MQDFQRAAEGTAIMPLYDLALSYFLMPDTKIIRDIPEGILRASEEYRHLPIAMLPSSSLS